MIRKIATILRRYFKEAYDEEEQWEAIISDPFDLTAMFPTYDMLLRLSKELIMEIKKEDLSKLIKIPDQKSTIKFVRSISTEKFVDDFPEFYEYHARELRRWLWEWNTTLPIFRNRNGVG